MKEITIPVTHDMGGKELRTFLREQGISATALRRLKASGGILVDGIPTGVRTRLLPEQVITLRFEEHPSAYVQPEKMTLDVLYEDQWLLAVNKPADMPVHPSAGHHTGTLANGVCYYMREQSFTFRPVTRLDRYTSGIVLIAKDGITAAALCKQMGAGAIEKTYYALTDGVPATLVGTVDLPIARVEGSVLKRQVSPGGKPAVTHYRVLGCEEGRGLLELHPVTGRTHQIRVHMAHLGCPLCFDFLYGKEVPGRHFYLHCGSLTFVHPHTNQKISIKSPYKLPDLD